jgi:hypothetical protein
MSCLAFDAPPSSLAALVGQELFCSAVCARAYLLEAIELFGVSAATSVVQDVDEVRSDLGSLYAAVARTAY